MLIVGVDDHGLAEGSGFRYFVSTFDGVRFTTESTGTGHRGVGRDRAVLAGMGESVLVETGQSSVVARALERPGTGPGAPTGTGHCSLAGAGQSILAGTGEAAWAGQFTVSQRAYVLPHRWEPLTVDLWGQVDFS